MTKIRLILFVISLIIVSTFTYVASLYARGYRFDKNTFKFVPNGLFVINSDPTGAQIFVNGELKTATDATLPLSPGTYDIAVIRDGYHNWTKRLVIEKELVTQVEVLLFSTAPSLSAITFSGSFNPILSSDQTKIAYGVPLDKGNGNNKPGLWVIDTVDLPVGFTREPRQITDGDLDGSLWEWSPDGRQILLTTKKAIYLLDSGVFTPQSKLVNVSSRKDSIIASWEEEKSKKLSSKLSRLPEELENIFKKSAKNIQFSPDEIKILYAASESATLPDGLVKRLPGVSTQREERNIKPGKKYVYDIKEDRNFEVGDATSSYYWLITSAHLLVDEPQKIVIMDYDGTNIQTVYSGSYLSPYAYPSTNKTRLVVLTNLGAGSGPPNLYYLSLR